MRNGRKIRLSQQSSSILLLLLERAGTVVTREHLRQHLWPNGEFVDYDHSINNAISQLRVVLRVDAKTPSAIETIPKRGYRFAGEVQVTEERAPEELAARPVDVGDAEAEPELEQDSEGVAPVAVVPGASQTATGIRAVRRWPLVVVAACVLLLIIAGISYASRRNTVSANPHYIYVGVAPFEVTGAGSEELAESFRMDLTDALSQLPAVRVRAGHSLADKAKPDADLRGVSQALGVDVIVFGRFALEGDQCVLQVELVRGRDTTHIASLRYTGTKYELGNIRNRAQRDIYTKLDVSGNVSAPGSTVNPRAYEAYLRGRYYLSLWRDSSVKRSVAEFESAIKEDPDFAKAYAGIASAYMVLADQSVAKPDESYGKAAELATKAVQMDPSMAEAHATLGYVALHKDWDFNTAERELRKAVDLDPSQAIYRIWLAQLLSLRGRFDEALQQVDEAHAADPFWAPVYMTEIYISYAARQNARAMRAADKVIDMMPDWPLARDQHGWLNWYSGHYEEAIADWRKMATMEKDAARLELEERGWTAYRKGGVRAYAKVRLDAITSGKQWAHSLTDFVPAEWYVYAGEHDKAIAALDELVNRRDLAALQISVNPAYSDLYADPRFRQLIERVGVYMPLR